MITVDGSYVCLMATGLICMVVSHLLLSLPDHTRSSYSLFIPFMLFFMLAILFLFLTGYHSGSVYHGVCK